jgi:hypothetical protein
MSFTRYAPVIMKGPKGICCFLVARPDIRSAMPQAAASRKPARPPTIREVQLRQANMVPRPAAALTSFLN